MRLKLLLSALLLLTSVVVRLGCNLLVWNSSPRTILLHNAHTHQHIKLCWIPMQVLNESCWSLKPQEEVSMDASPLHLFRAELQGTRERGRSSEDGIDECVVPLSLFGAFFDTPMKYSFFSQAPGQQRALRWRLTRLLESSVRCLTFPSPSRWLFNNRHEIYVAIWCVLMTFIYVNKVEKQQPEQQLEQRRRQRPSKSLAPPPTTTTTTTHDLLLCIGILCMLLDHYGRVFDNLNNYEYTMPAQFFAALLFYFLVGSSRGSYESLDVKSLQRTHQILLGYALLKTIEPVTFIEPETLLVIGFFRIVLSLEPLRRFLLHTASINMHLCLLAFLFQFDSIIGGDALKFAYGIRGIMAVVAGALVSVERRRVATLYLTALAAYSALCNYLYVILPAIAVEGKQHYMYYYVYAIALLLTSVALPLVLGGYYRFTSLAPPSSFVSSILSTLVRQISRHSLSIYILHIYMFKLLSPYTEVWLSSLAQRAVKALLIA